MDLDLLLKSDLFVWVVLPLLIFVARVADVSMGTLRMILVARGIRWLAPLIGFFEVLIWLVAVGQTIQHLSNVICYLSFSVGFATGTFVGMLVESRLCIGKAVIRTITNKEAFGLVESLREANCGVTTVDAQGATGPVKIIFSVVERRDLTRVVGLIKTFDPQAFYTIGDVKHVGEGVFPPREPKLLAFARFTRAGR